MVTKLAPSANCRLASTMSMAVQYMKSQQAIMITTVPKKPNRPVMIGMASMAEPMLVPAISMVPPKIFDCRLSIDILFLEITPLAELLLHGSGCIENLTQREI